MGMDPEPILGWPNLGRSRDYERERAQARKDMLNRVAELEQRAQHEELFGRPNMELQRVIEVNRDEWAVGQEVIVRDDQREFYGGWRINAIDWSRGAGPIRCARLAESLPPAWVQAEWFQPWHLTHPPTTIEEIEAFLGN